ncbi:WXG100 family type VII secretion target [Streptomyces sp. NBC_01334]|uniref:WXG100 family type VII secretion target n=1 Tax=Streptomyces sp. NBC_01334 TaxID=2903827 RepID=UPI002E12DC46|nr:hypothetical protein OG736_31625 [Streptomyces sp. NBC_01334]
MADHDKKSDHYRTERQEAAQQNTGVDDAVNKAVVISPGSLSSPGGFGRTSFEGYDLNAMIDIVESANPETLESAATALVDARDAINDAANELSRNLGNVDWEGEAHTAFYTWGMNLTTTALALATYTDEVGTQVLAASSGLASVRKSMPPRDSRVDPKKVDDIPTPQRVEGNEEYTAAVKAEKDRQEAINQMYRLASFYTVSSGMMELAEEPVFPQMPAVGVPEPDPSLRDPIEPRGDQGSLSAQQGSVGTHRSSAETEVVRARSDQQSSHQTVVDSVTLPEQHVGTEIDSVGTLPPQQTVTPQTVTSPSATGPNANPVSTAPSFPTVGVPPALRGPAGRTSGFGGMPGAKTPNSAQGRVGGVTGRTPTGRTGTGPMGSMGRTAGPGQAGSRAVGPLGRGVVGGTAKAGGTAAKQAGGVPRGPVSGTGAANTARTGAGRANGVVGGKPVTGAAPGTNGPRLPRGTVIGGEGTPASRATAEKPGQRGVIGAPGSAAGAGQASRRSGKGSRNSGHSPGGTGSVRGQTGNQGSGKTRSRRDERRDEASSTD